MPMLRVSRGPIAMSFTAKDLSFGMERTRALVEKQIPSSALQKRLPSFADKRISSVRDAQQDLLLVLEYSKWAVFAFLPALALGLLGGIGMLRKRVGRVLGALAIPLGAASIAGWFGLRYAMQYAIEEAGIDRLEVTMQLGGHLLLVTGGLGVLAGFGAVVQPDVKEPPQSVATSARLR